MGRKGLVAVLMATSCIAGVASSNAASNPTPKPVPICGPVKETTLAEGPKARAYEISGTEAVFGCSPSGPHPWKLGPFGSARFGGARLMMPPLLNGIWAGGLLWRHGRDTYRYSVRSRNLRTGGEIRCEAGGGIAPTRGERIYNVVLSGHGSLAWSGEYWRPIYEPPVAPGPGATAPMPIPRKHISQCTETGMTVVERGEEIAVKSLVLSGERLTWMNGAEEKSTQLP
jgi:hypothetical protein